MPETYLFEYAVLRIVPRVERGEFLNAGVILYCRDQHFLDAKFILDEKRLSAFSPGTDVSELEKYLLAFRRICRGEEGSGPIGRLTLPERFRWLTAIRSTVIQTSGTHPGLCADAGLMLDHLYCKMVL
jgi:hypothetical protein